MESMLLNLKPVTLYKLGAKHLQVWTISVINHTLFIEYGIQGGAMQIQTETIEKGKGGRTLHQQIKSRFESRINAQKLRGYKETIEEAKQGPTNAMGLVQPMLAQVYDKTKVDISDAFVQYKYDGNRCLITKQNGKVIAYSRRGKVIDTIDHITNDLNLLEGETVDGELYSHGATLQEIVSWVRRKQPGTSRVKFHAYDYVSHRPYSHRLELLNAIHQTESFTIVPTWHISQIKSLDETFHEAREQGYEGLILRVGSAGYEMNKRSKSLLKVKTFLDDEFFVIDAYLSKQGVPMLTCLITNNEALTFDVVAPGTFDDKMNILQNSQEYLGKYLTVKFSGYTKDMIPFQPIALRFRSAEDVGTV